MRESGVQDSSSSFRSGYVSEHSRQHVECAGKAQRRPELYTALQSQRDCASKPYKGCDAPLFCVATLGNRCLKYFNLEEVAPLIPKVTLVPLQRVLPQQGTQFLSTEMWSSWFLRSWSRCHPMTE